MAAKPVVHLKWLPRIEARVVDLYGMLQVFRVDSFRPSVSKFLFHRSTGELQPSAVQEIASLVGTRHPEQDRGGIGHNPKTCLALSQGMLGLLSLLNQNGDEVKRHRS